MISSVSQMPSHSHSTYLWAGEGKGSGTQAFDSTNGPWGPFPYASTNAGGNGAHTHKVKANTSSNLPRYYALAFIKKIR